MSFDISVGHSWAPTPCRGVLTCDRESLKITQRKRLILSWLLFAYWNQSDGIDFILKFWNWTSFPKVADAGIEYFMEAARYAHWLYQGAFRIFYFPKPAQSFVLLRFLRKRSSCYTVIKSVSPISYRGYLILTALCFWLRDLATGWPLNVYLSYISFVHGPVVLHRQTVAARRFIA
jgi:hypothetical protein